MGTVRYTNIEGQIVAEKRDGMRRTYVPDTAGSTAAMLDSSQQRVAEFRYWPHGTVASALGLTASRFRFLGVSGARHDAGTRIWVRVRELDTNIARWMNSNARALRQAGSEYAFRNPLRSPRPAGRKDPRCKPDNPVFGGYGCYCGGDRNPHYDHKPYELPDSVDHLDACCRAHDYVYWDQDVNKCDRCRPVFDRKKRCIDADRALCQCARSVSCSVSPYHVRKCKIERAGIIAIFCRNGRDRPDPNPEIFADPNTMHH